MKIFLLTFSLILSSHIWANIPLPDSVSENFESIISFTGTAHDLKTGKLIYTEHHQIQLDSNGDRESGTVHYKNTTSDLIATKSLDYDQTGFFPSFQFTDLRSDHLINVTLKGTNIDIELGLPAELELDSLDVLKNQVMIADAGFDVFMLKNWQDLIAGNRRVVEFLAPTRAIFVTFYIERTFINNDRVGFILAPDSFLIGLLVDPIMLEYDRETGRILSYKGLTNLEKVNGKKPSGDNYLAEITYQY
ncbi:MAG: hypothetical protein ACJA0E_001549 [Bermanella sp.]|jgi:hypothetical protein